MKKKFAAMFMAAAMVFTMAACGQKADTPSTPDADGSGDQSGAEVQTFVLGSCGPLTGSAAIYGQAVVNGAELAVDEINASDSTVKFTFLKQDDEADGEKAAQRLQHHDGRGACRSSSAPPPPVHPLPFPSQRTPTAPLC